MSIADKVRVIYGIRRFLDKYEIDVNIEKDRNINPIFLEFAKSMGWEEHFKKSNKKGYRGKFEPSLCNAEIVSANFKDFRVWVCQTYKLRTLALPITPIYSQLTQNQPTIIPKSGRWLNN